jgi:hypothetical protein
MNVPFTMLPNLMLADERLSYSSICTIFYLKSKPLGWRFRSSELKKSMRLTDWEWRKVYRILKSLGILESKKTKKGKQLCFLGLDGYIQLSAHLLPVDNSAPSESHTLVANATHTLVANAYSNTIFYNTDLNKITGSIITARARAAKASPVISNEKQKTKRQKDNILTKEQSNSVAKLGYDENKIYNELISWGMFKANALDKVAEHSVGDLHYLLEGVRARKIDSLNGRGRYFTTCYKKWKKTNYRPIDFDKILEVMKNAGKI